MTDRILQIIITIYSISFSLLICFEEYSASMICLVGAYICIRYCQRDIKIVKLVDKLI